MLALDYDTAMLAGALVGRLGLDRRVDDANKLACLLTATNIGRGLSDLDTPEIALAHAFDATTLAAALVGRLSLDGRMERREQARPSLRGDQHRHPGQPRAYVCGARVGEDSRLRTSHTNSGPAHVAAAPAP